LTHVEDGFGPADEPEYLALSLADFLELVSVAEPAPAGGSVVALTLGLAAGLCAMAARLSTSQLPDAAGLTAAAEALRDRAASLSQADAAAYRRVILAQRSAREPDPVDRRHRIDIALGEAAEIPIELAEIGAELAGLAARIAEEGNPNLLADAVTAAFLADAAVRSARILVIANLKALPSDARLERAAVATTESAVYAARARRMIEP